LLVRAVHDRQHVGTVLVLHLQLVELFGNLLVFAPQSVQLLFVFAYGVQQLRVGRLPREELLHDLLDVAEAGLRSDLLERALNLRRLRHLRVHFVLQELSPELLSKEVFIHFKLVGVFVVVGGLVADLLLSRVPLDTPLQRCLFVVERLQDRGETIFPLEVVLVDQSHQLFQSVLRLQSLLLGLTVFLGFLLENLLLVLEALRRFVLPDLNGNQVRLHAVDHVLVGPLHHQLVLVRVLDSLQSVHGVLEAVCLSENVVFNRALLGLCLLQLPLNIQIGRQARVSTVV